MNTRLQVIARIEAHITETGISERQFGLSAVGDHKFLSRLRAGLGVTLTSIEKAERFMEQHQHSLSTAPPNSDAEETAA